MKKFSNNKPKSEKKDTKNAARTTTPTNQSTLLNLQRSIGNRRIANMLEQPSEHDVNVSISTPKLQKNASNMIQRVLTSAITFDNTVLPAVSTVTNVQFAGRPNIPYKEGPGNGEGDHNIAFVVFERIVSKAVIGKTFTQSLNNLKTLYDGLPNFPGYNKGFPADVNYRDFLKTTDVTEIDNILNGITNIADLYKAQTLAYYCQRYIELRSRLHYVSRNANLQDNTAPNHPTPANNQTGANFLNTFAPAGATLTALEVNSIEQNLRLTFDFRPKHGLAQNIPLIGDHVASLIITAFQGFSNIIPDGDGESDIVTRVIAQYIAIEGAHYGWNGVKNLIFENQVRNAVEHAGFNGV